MKIAELLRNLADVIDLERQSSAEVGSTQGDSYGQSNRLTINNQ